MHKLRAYLPSANALFTFEAAARRGSFTAAAEELNVSQPAVSKSIRLLEQALGFRLFYRHHTRLELTAEGKRLLAETEAAFDGLHHCITAMRHDEGRDRVRAAFSSSFLQFWLLPRISEFSDRHPDIRLSIEESSYDDLDLFAHEIDLSARLGRGEWPELQSWELVPEIIYPVASPVYVAQHGLTPPDAVLHGQRLIHFRERNRVRWGWGDWMAAQGQPSPRLDESYVFTDALNSLAAASLGQGIALAWAHLVVDQVAAGSLVRVGAPILTGKSVFLTAARRKPLSAASTKFVDWILDRMRRDQQGHPGCFPRPAV